MTRDKLFDAPQSAQDLVSERTGRRFREIMDRFSILSDKKVLADIELYDIADDPGEQNNIAARHPGIVRKMLAEYEDWFSS